MAESSSLSVATNIFVAPNQAFAAIKERPTALFPILVIIVLYGATTFTYLSSVDLPWFMEQQILMSNPDATEEQREQAVRATENLPPMAVAVVPVVAAAIGIVIVFLIIGLYYTVISFFTNDGIRFKQWFSLVSWCSLPFGLGLVASLVNIAFGDARFMLQEDVNPLAFGNLLGIAPENPTPVQRVMLSLDFTTLWCTVLLILGYQAWTKSSLVKTVAVVLGPWLVIVAIGALIALT